MSSANLRRHALEARTMQLVIASQVLAKMDHFVGDSGK